MLGTGQTVALWEGPSSVTDSETLGNAPITVSGNNAIFGGSVGIGSSPSDKLTVSGSGNFGIKIDNSSNTSSDYSAIRLVQDSAEKGVIYTNQEDLYLRSPSGDVLLQHSGGNVGIGTTSPDYKLQVGDNGVGDGNITMKANGVGANAGAKLTFNMNVGGGNADSYIAQIVPISYDSLSSGTHNSLNFKVGTWNNNADAGVSRMTILSNGNIGIGTTDPGTARLAVIGGNVGIGTTSPGQKLDVVGGFIRSISTGANLVQGAFVAQSSTTDSPGYRGQGYFTYNEELDVSWYMGTPYTNGDMFSINRQNTTTSFDTGAANMNGTNVDNFFAIKNNGNVGIGENNPSSLLHLKKAIGDPMINIQAVASGDPGITFTSINNRTGNIFYSDGTTNAMLRYDHADVSFKLYAHNTTVADFVLNETTAYFPTQNVGIGTTTPNSPLDIRRTSDGIALELISTVGDADEFVDLKMISGNTTAGTLGTILRHKRDGTGGGDFSILTNPTLTGTPTEKLTVKSNGNVGIGTTTPLAKLDIQGTQGQLFSVTDDLSGSIFAVADISGVPIFDVNSSGVSYFDGNVGIGTTSPASKLVVEGAGEQWISVFTTDTTGAGAENGYRTQSSTGSRQNTLYRHTATNLVTLRAGTDDGAINFIAGGSAAERMRILANGNVGIGTTSPAQNFVVADATLGNGIELVPGATATIQTYNRGSSSYNNLNLDVARLLVRSFDYTTINTGSALTERMRWLADGQFWIKLNSTTSGREAAMSNDEDKLRIFGSRHGGTGKYVSIWSDGANENARFYSTNTVFYKNVGIGTTSPDSRLTVSSGTTNAVANFKSTDAAAYIAIADNSSTNALVNQIGVTGNDMWFATDDVERMRIDSSGNVGIGASTTSPSHKLEVRDGTISGEIAKFSAIGATVVIESSTAGNAKLFLKPNTTGSKRAEFRVTDANDYGFLWTADTSANGTAYMELEASSTGGGDLTVKGDVIAYGSPSDKKYKENIKPIESALDKAMKLQGVTFDWKDSDSILEIKEDIGFIAQDVQEVLPELVRENGKGNLSLRYQGITPILLEAIKELKAEIEELKLNNCNCNK